MHANGFAVGDSIGVVYQKDNPENNMTVFEYYDGPSYGFVSAFVILVVILAIIRWRKISKSSTKLMPRWKPKCKGHVGFIVPQKNIYSLRVMARPASATI